ncbi:MAG: transcription termination/antitermination protein NusA [Parcubacteria group bacterium]|nr:transcription termination/antitermination protein NusA [Parcubacteria group bacterium]
MPTEFEFAIEQICEEKGISKEAVIETIEAALAAAYRKDYGEKGQNIEATFSPKDGQTKVFEVQEIVEEVENSQRELTKAEGQKIKKGVKVGDEIRTEVTPKEINFGRIAAQTAKQVIAQKIREAEKDAIFEAFKDRVGELVNGVVQRIEGGMLFVDLGQAVGILSPQEQMPQERYQIGDRLRILIADVSITPKGPEVVLSRSRVELINKLFEMEIPEVAAGTVEIKSIAREVGLRSKVAVKALEEEVDPIGACVGQRGARIQTIIAELSGEKIDIIAWDDNVVKFITNALSPAKVLSVRIDEKKRHAIVEVAEDQLSLAIGKGGQNVRLAVKLTGWDIDVVGEEQEKEKAKDSKAEKSEEKTEEKAETEAKKDDSKEEEKKADKKKKSPAKIKSPAKKKTKPAKKKKAKSKVKKEKKADKSKKK